MSTVATARTAVSGVARTGTGHVRAGAAGAWNRIRRNPKSSASTGFVAIAALGLILAMVFADGFRATSYDLKSAGVWVVNQDAQRFGRVNARIREQDGKGDAAIHATSVLQDGGDVFVQVENGLQRVSPATMDAEGDVVQIAPDSIAALGGGRLAVIDASGKLRLSKSADAATLSATDQAEAPEDASADDSGVALDEGPGARLAIGRHGDIVVASPEHDRISVLRPGAKEAEVTAAKFEGEVQVSAAGRQPVALHGATLVLPGGRTKKVAGGSPRLQLPSDDSEHVLVATDAGIMSFRVDGDGDPELLSTTAATPAAANPVNINGCTYGAWAGPEPKVLYVCGSDRVELDYPEGVQVGSEPRLAWQVNGDYVVLNDLASGLVLVVSDGELYKADQWDKEETNTGDSEQKSEDRTPDPNFVPTDNTPPEAHDDEYGARPAAPAILPVLDNDKDADGDVLSIRAIDEAPDGTKVEVVRDGTAVQITPSQNLEAGDLITFSYVVSDGWPGTESACEKCKASVTVTIADPNENRPPELKKDRLAAHLSVGSSARATYPVLDDWIDPDGDPIILSGAAVDDPTVAEVSAQTDGLLTYVDRSAVAGEHTVTFRVSDVPLTTVAAGTAEGSLAVTVEATNTPPVARSDYAATAPGLPVVVWPLRNDTDADGDDLSFTLIPAGGVPAEAHQNGDGSVTVSSATAQTIQFGYEVNDGHNAPIPARIRVDVLAPTPLPPSAGLDVVVLPAPPASGARSSRTVDLLANDVSPSGNVLVVTRITAHGTPVYGLETQLGEHRRLTASYPGRLAAPALFDYTLSDGNTTTTGQVVVVSAALDTNLAPIPVGDQVDVRVGDMVSVPVLTNDIDPEGSELFLRSAKITRGSGIVFTSGQRVRFLAPAEPGSVDITYTLGDDPQAGSGNEATARLTVTVRETTSNAAPIPPPVDARVVSGSTVRITVPLAGIDPDGDSVTLLGLGLEGNVPQVPEFGRITGMGLDTFTYQAFAGKAGTDVFRYRVVDTGGPSGAPLEAEGVIRVGVAASDGQNGSPTPRSDTFTVRPGPARLDVLVNDFDPDGDEISLVTAEGPPELKVKRDDGRVVATFPEVDQPTPFALTYSIADRSAVPQPANVAVTVDPNATGAPPIARDDIAKPDADPKATRVMVDVLDNDDDPDGDPAKLEVAVVEGQTVDATVDGGRLSIAVTGRTQLVAYRITDAQDLTATAIVRVPPAGTAADLPPVLRPGARAVSKGDKTGETVKVKIDEVALDPEGEPLRLDGANPLPVNGTATVLDATTFEFTPDVYDPQNGTGPRGAGVASVSFIVSDGPEGEVGQRAVLTLPIDVELNAPAIPAWTAVSALDVSVYQGDEPASVDLRLAVTDEDSDPSDLRFEITDDSPTIDGVTVTIEDDHILTAVVADAALQPNLDLGAVIVQVTDQDDLHAVEPAHVSVRTVPTDRFLPALATFDTEAESGKATTVDILQGATSPFDESIEEAMKVDPTTVRTRSGKGEAAAQGTHEITFTPSSSPESVGTATVSFEVIDVVGRRVPGTVSFTVSSVPSAPGAPTARQVSASSVEVAWAAADKHGKEIGKYTVTDNLQRTSECGTELSCLIEGLTPGTTYTFTVVATNERGDGPASPSSPTIRPDECPAAPTNVQLTFDAKTNPATGGQLVASWVKPENKGTAIEGYEVRVSPASSSPLTDLVTGTTVTLSGLTNGVPHTVTVRAKNQCDGGGLGASADSNAEIPAGVPDPPTEISAADALDPTGGRITLTWRPPAAAGAVSDHGDRVTQYSIAATEGTAGFGGGVPQMIQPSSLKTNANGTVTASLSVDRNLDAYRFTVTATNKAGIGAASEASAAQTARGKPTAPELVSATFDPESTAPRPQVALTFNGSADAGDDRFSYQYRQGAGAWTNVPDDKQGLGTAQRSFVIAGVDYGDFPTFQVRTVNDSFNTESATKQTSVPGGNPSAIYGAFDAPTIGCSDNVQVVTCNWSGASTRGNSVSLILSGSPFSGPATGSNRSATVGYSQSGIQQLTAQDTHGRSKSATEARWSTQPKPPDPTVSISAPSSPATEAAGCNHGDFGVGDTKGCFYLSITMNNFDSGSHVIRCYMSMNAGDAKVYKTITRSGNGTFQDCSFSSAGRWVWVVVDGTVGAGNMPNQYQWAVDHHTGTISNVSNGGVGWPA